LSVIVLHNFISGIILIDAMIRTNQLGL